MVLVASGTTASMRLAPAVIFVSSVYFRSMASLHNLYHLIRWMPVTTLLQDFETIHRAFAKNRHRRRNPMPPRRDTAASPL